MGSCQTGSCGTDNQKPDEDAGIRESLGKIRHKLLVMSGKGGVGKTSVSDCLSTVRPFSHWIGSQCTPS